ncbi:MAG: DUF6456 domain-containing protein [Rhizomicrobium sp.]
MSAPTTSELAREARKILRKLLGGAHLRRGEDGRFAVVLRANGAQHAKTKVDAALAAAMRAKGWLAAEGEDGARLVLTPAGEGWYLRALAGCDPFAAQHQLRRTQTIWDEQGRERRVVVNAAESPLLWMRQRGLVSELQCQAGERLRRDFTLAQLAPRLGVDWSAPAVFGRRAQKPELLSDTVLAAKQRFSAAMRAAGPGLADILFDVCCHLSGLEQSERTRGWPRASAKVVLKIALDRLAHHYGMIFAPRPARVRSWTMDEGAMEEEALGDDAPTPRFSQGEGGQNG